MAGRGEARYRLTLDQSGFEQGAKYASDQWEKFGATLAKGVIGFELGEKAAELLMEAVKGVGAAVVESVEHFAEYGHQIELVEAKTGLSSDAIQKLAVAAKLTGTSLEAVTSVVGKMEKNLVTNAKAFEAMGLSATALKAMRPEQAFEAIAERIRDIKNPMEQAAAAQAVFGKSWQELAAIIKDPSVLDAADRLGAKVGEEDVHAAADLARAGRELSVAWESVENQFAAAVLSSPQLINAMHGAVAALVEMAHWVNENKGAISVLLQSGWMVATSVAGALETAVRKLGGAYLWVAEHVMPTFVAELKAGLAASNAVADAQAAADLARKLLAPKGGGGGGTYTYDPEAKKKAEEVQKAWQEAAEKARKEWDKFYLDEEHAGSEALLHLAGDMDRYVDKITAQRTRYMEQWINDLAKGRAAEASEMDYAARVDEDLAAARRRRMEETADGFRSLAGVVGSLGGVWGTVGAGILSVLGNVKTKSLEAASATQKIAAAAQAAVQAFQSGSVLGGAAAGAATGASIGGWVGAGIGAVAGALAGLFGKKHRESDELKQLSADFAKLQQQAAAAGVVLNHALDPHNAQQYKAAINDLKGALDLNAQAHQALDDAVQRYGFTVDELGPKFRQQKLDEQAGQLLQDYELLTASGIEHNTVLEKMGPSFNDYVQTAVKGGVAIPEAMRPILEDLIAHGKLLDENGNAYTSLEQVGVTFAQTMSEQFQGLMSKITDLVNALLGIPNVSRTVTVNTNYQGGGGGGGEEGNHNRNGEGYASGGYVPATPGGRTVTVGEGGEGEYIVPESKAHRALGGTQDELAGELRGLRAELRAANRALPKLIRDAVLLG